MLFKSTKKITVLKGAAESVEADVNLKAVLKNRDSK